MKNIITIAVVSLIVGLFITNRAKAMASKLPVVGSLVA